VKPKFILLFCIASFILALITLLIVNTNHQKQVSYQNKLKVEAQVKTFFPVLPTLESIFSIDHTWTATLSAERIWKMIVTGDVIPARSVNYNMVTKSNPLWPYEKVAPTILSKHADVTLINLEAPLIKDSIATTEGMIFSGSPKNVKGLKYIDVSIASLANNHSGNYGIEGVTETVNLLNAENIDVIGIGKQLIRNIKGVRVAFLSYNDIGVQPGISNVNENLIVKDIAQVKQKADIIIVMMHWGTEYQSQPDQRQIYLAHFLIDNGTDLVVGNHPHWIQTVESYKGKVIMYAHGNFIFDQMWSMETRTGVIGLYTFYGKELVDIEFLPLQINDYGQPFFLLDSDKQSVLDKMRTESYQTIEQSNN
jgi:poly-gamma-glutamate capsule biosynthesis protein CapA/YwtB (metallophosphatase superfamily)